MPLFVLEGIDGSGTTTVSNAVVENLSAEGKKVVWTCEPTNSEVGKIIRLVLSKQLKLDPKSLLHFFLADRHLHVQNFIQPCLENGTIVVCDRYVYSTWVYQQDYFSTDVVEPFLLEFPTPEKVYLLHTSVDVAEKRRKARDSKEELFDERLKQEAYTQRYLKLAFDNVFSLGNEDFIILNSDANSVADLASFISSDISSGIFRNTLGTNNA